MIAEDLRAFYADFGISGIFDGGRSVFGIFDRPSSASFDLAGRQPRFRCAAADVPSPVGKLLLILGETFTIRAAEPDGTGETILTLSSNG